MFAITSIAFYRSTFEDSSPSTAITNKSLEHSSVNVSRQIFLRFKNEKKNSF